VPISFPESPTPPCSTPLMCYPVASAVVKTSTVAPTVGHAALGVVIGSGAFFFDICDKISVALLIRASARSFRRRPPSSGAAGRLRADAYSDSKAGINTNRSVLYFFYYLIRSTVPRSIPSA
jgi:hypothetical protein